MNTLAAGLHAALLLARGRAHGLDLLTAPGDRDHTDALALARRSFWAMPVALPGFVALHAMDWLLADGQAKAGGPAGHAFAQDLLGFAIGWLGFVLLSHRIAEATGRQARWPRFIAAWNWCNVIQYMMLVVASLPALLGMPSWLVETCWLAATGWALWLEYFVARLALATTARFAVGLVMLDVGLGLAVALGMAVVS